MQILCTVIASFPQRICCFMLWPDEASLTYTKSILQHQKISFCSWIVADAISRVLENSEELHSWRKRLLSACIKGLIVMYNSGKDESKQEVERSMLLRLEELLVRLLFIFIAIM